MSTQDLTDDLIEFLSRYYEEDVGQLAQHYPRDQQSLYIDFDDVYQYDPDLADDVREHPRKILPYFKEALGLYDLPVDVDLSEAHVRVHNLPDSDVLDVAKVPRHTNIGRLLGLNGQVQKVSAVKPRVTTAVFECERCGATTEIPQTGDQLQEPYECVSCERQGPFSLNASASEWTNHQYARVQQPPERTKGGEGETVDVHLVDDLIQEFEAGDRVTLTGVLDIEDAENEDSRDFDTTLDGKAVVREESDYEDIDVEAHREEIKAIASGERGDPYQLLVDSINPSHKGDEDVKLAIALQLFGGWSRGGRVRGDSHVLLMGDPGCGKSTFLKAVDELAPRSTFASGQGATAAGLTAAAVADDFGDTEWGLEAGALVLADQGVACIDEIDKVPETAVSSLHDALESQKVRVNKAGINATLSSRAALLAAGNPAEGRFDPYQPRAQQIDLGPTLMSRFDLMFMVSDSPDPDDDRAVVDHQQRSRRAAAKQELDVELTEEERASVESAIPEDVLRAYIAYAKENVTPYIRGDNSEAQEHLREEFLKLRMANSEGDDNPVPVTFRQEEAIERLAEASARVRLSDEVTKEDVERALSLVQKSMQQVGIDPETGDFDADVVETGSSKSQRDRRKQVLAIVGEHDGTTVEEVADIMKRNEEKVEHAVEKLKQRGELYERNGEIYHA
jgi:replicative DNA helicase Mcm